MLPVCSSHCESLADECRTTANNCWLSDQTNWRICHIWIDLLFGLRAYGNALKSPCSVFPLIITVCDDNNNNFGRHSGAHASGLLCERYGSLRWCSSWTGGWMEDSQMQPFGTDRSPVSTDLSRDTWPVEWIIDHFLFRAGPQDRVYFRRQPRAQLSFPEHIDYDSAL